MDKLNYTELAKNDRRMVRAWRWLKHRLRLDGAKERRERERRTISVYYGDLKDATVLTNPCEKKP